MESKQKNQEEENIILPLLKGMTHQEAKKLLFDTLNLIGKKAIIN